MLSERSSQILNNLKCLLPIFVVFNHVQIPRPITWYEFHGELGGAISDYRMFVTFQKVFADVFCGHCCVPTFFFISGYLFFLKYKDVFSVEDFKQQVHKRVYNLFIPFIIANLVYFIILRMCLNIGQSKGLFADFWGSFWSYQNTNIPINGPLWYVRNLLGLVILSPFIYYWLKSFKQYALLLIGVLWSLNVWFGNNGFDCYPFVVFSCGAFLAINDFDIVAFFKHYLFVVLSVFFVLLLFFVSYVGFWFGDHDSFYSFLFKPLQLLSIPFWFVVVTFVSGFSRYFALSKRMATAFFFVYLYHYGFRLLLRNVIEIYNIPNTNLSFFVWYFGGGIVVILVLLAVYFIANKYLPRLVAVIVGGR